MKRREFVVGVTSITGLFAIGRVRAQVPCPPILMGSSDQPADCPAGVPEPSPDGNGFPDGPLKIAALSLGYGQQANAAIEIENVFEFRDMNWQAQCHYDPNNHLIHVMGKPANANNDWMHRYYDIRNDTWVTVGLRLWTDSGHIYDNMTIDPMTGDVFCVSRERNLHWYKAADRKWSSTFDAFPTKSDGSLNGHCNGAAYHPHLYGANDGALCVHNGAGWLSVWRRSTQTIEEINTGTGFGSTAGVGVYHENADAVILGGSKGGKHFVVTPNAGGTPIVRDVGTPPKWTAGDTYNNNYGCLVPHPQNGTVLLIDRETTNNVWETDDGDNWTAKPDYSLVNSGGDSFVCCAIPELGVVFATGISDNPRESMHVIWRPES